jgi:dipeptidyl aminopeptidase/acylaminoacyl peptidase/TPR repeat protein
VPRDDAEAVRWFRQAAELGNSIGQYSLARMYFQGRGVPQDDVAMVTWLRRAAAQSHAPAMGDLGFAYFEGRGIARSDEEAVRWSRRAAERGVIAAQRNLGVAYRDGRAVPRDEAEAVRWFERAAKAGSAASMNDLGRMYSAGRGVARDADQAAHWFRRAAEAGDANGQRNLGLAYLDGRGVPRDDAEAARWLRRAADHGNDSAMTDLGVLYYTGRGVPQDYAEAVRWFRRAADDGHAVAQRNLGLAVREGRAVPRDDTEAARWLERAAEQDDAGAQFHLAELYAHGTGVARDPVRAYIWYSRAATGLGGEHGARARAERDILRLLLTSDDLARAEALAATWTPRPRPEAAREASAASGESPSLTATAPPPLKGLIPRRALFVPLAEEPRLSPDGRRLAYLAPADGSRDIWVRTVGAEDDRVLTADRGQGIRAFTWQCDGQHILYLQDRDGDERWRLHQIDVTTKTTRDLTPRDAVRVASLRLDCRSPDQALLGAHRGTRVHPDVHRLDLRTGVAALDTENPGDVVRWLADGALQVRGAEGMSPEGPLIRIRQPDRGPWRLLKRWGADLVGFSPDGRNIELVSDAEAPAKRVLRVDVESGAVTVLAEDPHHDAAAVLRHPRTGEVQAVAFDRARREWTLVDVSLSADFAVIAGVRAGVFDVVSRDLEDRRWVIRYAADETPPEYFLYDRSTRRATLLFRALPAVTDARLARMQPITFDARDGMTLHGYLTLPVSGGLALPLVVLVHGGPWERDVWGWNPEAQWLANRGYAVLQVNFRGSTGYGRAYLVAGDREWGGRMLTDLLDAKAWAVRAGHADPRKVCIMGASYGGYAALSALTFAPDEFACGIALAAPSDLSALARSRWSLLRPVMDQRLGSPDKDEELLRSRSPLFAVERLRAPLLVAHGANDPNVSRLESDQLVAAARARGARIEYLVFPDEGHGLARFQPRIRFFAAAEQFLAEYLGGILEPPAPEEDWRPHRR